MTEPRSKPEATARADLALKEAEQLPPENETTLSPRKSLGHSERDDNELETEAE